MCRDDIEIIIKIPITDKPDRNGYTYSKEVIQKAVDDFNKNNKPMSLEITGLDASLGNVADMSIEDDKLVVIANSINGGTCESIKNLSKDTKTIKDMEFLHVGLVPLKFNKNDSSDTTISQTKNS